MALSSIPRPVFLQGRHFRPLQRKLLGWRIAAQYRLAVFQGSTLDAQVRHLRAPPRPIVLWIHTPAVNRYGDSREWPKSGLSWCLPGDWDIELTQERWSIFKAVTNTDKGHRKWRIHDTVRAMFIEGRHYRETSQYQAMMEAVTHAPPDPDWGCRTADEVEDYFRELILAFQSMRKQGYLSHRERAPHVRPAEVDELRLFISRQGELCQGNGANHRIKMAEILGIDWVPAVVRKFHPLWVLELCRRYELPPHRAIRSWFENSAVFSFQNPTPGPPALHRKTPHEPVWQADEHPR